MKRDIAEEIVEAMHEMDLAIDRLTTAVRRVEDETERKKMLKYVASIIHELHMQITLPVVRHHPDLHPDNPGSARY